MCPNSMDHGSPRESGEMDWRDAFHLYKNTDGIFLIWFDNSQAISRGCTWRQHRRQTGQRAMHCARQQCCRSTFLKKNCRVTVDLQSPAPISSPVVCTSSPVFYNKMLSWALDMDPCLFSPFSFFTQYCRKKLLRRERHKSKRNWVVIFFNKKDAWRNWQNIQKY